MRRDTQKCEVEFRLKILPSRQHDVDIRKIKLRATKSSSGAVLFCSVASRGNGFVYLVPPEVYLVLRFEPEVQVAKINRIYFRCPSTDLRKWFTTGQLQAQIIVLLSNFIYQQIGVFQRGAIDSLAEDIVIFFHI